MKLSSSTSCSSSMSPTICSSTSSMVITPETLPYSSITTAMWLCVSRNSCSRSFKRLLSGTKTAGRMQSLMSKRCSLSSSGASTSLACRMPRTSSMSSATTGKRECRDSMIVGTNSATRPSMSTVTTCERGTMMSRARMSATASAPWMMFSASLLRSCRSLACLSISRMALVSAGSVGNSSASHSRQDFRPSREGASATPSVLAPSSCAADSFTLAPPQGRDRRCRSGATALLPWLPSPPPAPPCRAPCQADEEPRA